MPARPSRLVLPGKTKPYLMAHRGNRVTCRENTLAAFRRAIAEGADIVETDLHLTADGILVCIHDATVNHTTDGSDAVAEMALQELKALSAAYGRPEFAAERIPTLAELATLLPGDLALALELKTDHFLEPQVCRRLVGELKQHGIDDQTVVLSFSLPRFRRRPSRLTGQPFRLASEDRLPSAKVESAVDHRDHNLAAHDLPF